MASASASPQAACSLLSGAEVRAIVGSPVAVFEPSSEAPTVRGNHTDSSCVYMPPGKTIDWKKGAGSGSIFLMWGTPATLTTGYNIYLTRHWIAQIKGNVLATATVSNGSAVDRTASRRLLDAVLTRLP